MPSREATRAAVDQAGENEKKNICVMFLKLLLGILKSSLIALSFLSDLITFIKFTK